MTDALPDRNGEPGNGLEWFGREVAAALTHKGVNQRQLADATGYKEPYVSKVKNGRARASRHFAEGCDRFFDTSGYFARLLVRVSERGHPGWFVPYINLEKQASRIENYSNAMIMGMLQTADYAEATFRATHPREEDDQIKARADARLARREVMERDAPPLLWVILHEATLRTEVGGRAVMADQLRHLASAAGSPHVILQVLRFNAGAPASSLPFILLTPAEGTTVLYSESRGQGHVSDSAAAVDSARTTYEQLRASARDPDESLALIREIAEEYAR